LTFSLLFNIIPSEIRSPIAFLGGRLWEGEFETPFFEREVGFFVLFPFKLIRKKEREIWKQEILM
jgi:hypothetical protein